MSFIRLHIGAFAVLAALVACDSVQAHGVVGDRFFPATVATDDPFAADELALPTISFGQGEEDYDFEWSKTIFPHVAVSIASGYIHAHPHGGPDASGWDNFEISPAWQFYTDPDSETVATAEMSFEIGGSGSKSVADRFTTYTPTLLFGHGFGSLPDSLALLRPLAITGTIGYAIPGTSTQSKSLEWGGAVEYSLLYLQTNVRDQGFSNFVAHLTPLVEFSLQSPTDTGGGGTTGTINPGLIWSGQYIQFAAEAVIPVNHASGNTVGGMVQLHFYVDDIFPDFIGRAALWRKEMKRIALIAVVAGLASPAMAHAFLEKASPAAGENLRAPAHVDLHFSESLEPSFSAVTVSDESGADVSAGTAIVQGTEMSLALKPLKPGRYRVTWHAVSVDTHRTEGKYNFLVVP